MGHGDKWIPADDQALARAWLFVSVDSIDGTNQTAEAFWEKVRAEYRRIGGVRAVTRGASSVKSRWNKTLRKEVMKFVGILNDIEALKPTGATDQDRLAMAIRRYSGLDPMDRNVSGDFPYLLAWQVLKDSPKFATVGHEVTHQVGQGMGSRADEQGGEDRLAGRSVIASIGDQSGANLCATIAERDIERPIGRKATKTKKA